MYSASHFAQAVCQSGELRQASSAKARTAPYSVRVENSAMVEVSSALLSVSV